MELAVILLLGSMLTRDGLGAPGWAGWLLAVVLLVVIRPLATLVSLLGSRVERPGERAFVAWFGVRGVGTLYYVATVVDGAARSPTARQKLVVWTAIAVRDRLDRRPRRHGGPSAAAPQRARPDPPLRPRPAREPATTRARR